MPELTPSQTAKINEIEIEIIAIIEKTRSRVNKDLTREERNLLIKEIDDNPKCQLILNLSPRIKEIETIVVDDIVYKAFGPETKKRLAAAKSTTIQLRSLDKYSTRNLSKPKLIQEQIEKYVRGAKTEDELQALSTEQFLQMYVKELEDLIEDTQNIVTSRRKVVKTAREQGAAAMSAAPVLKEPGKEVCEELAEATKTDLDESQGPIVVKANGDDSDVAVSSSKTITGFHLWDSGNTPRNPQSSVASDGTMESPKGLIFDSSLTAVTPSDLPSSDRSITTPKSPSSQLIDRIVSIREYMSKLISDHKLLQEEYDKQKSELERLTPRSGEREVKPDSIVARIREYSESVRNFKQEAEKDIKTLQDQLAESKQAIKDKITAYEREITSLTISLARSESMQLETQDQLDNTRNQQSELKVAFEELQQLHKQADEQVQLLKAELERIKIEASQKVSEIEVFYQKKLSIADKERSSALKVAALAELKAQNALALVQIADSARVQAEQQAKKAQGQSAEAQAQAAEQVSIAAAEAKQVKDDAHKQVQAAKVADEQAVAAANQARDAAIAQAAVAEVKVQNVEQQLATHKAASKQTVETATQEITNAYGLAKDTIEDSEQRVRRDLAEFEDGMFDAIIAQANSGLDSLKAQAKTDEVKAENARLQQELVQIKQQVKANPGVDTESLAGGDCESTGTVSSHSAVSVGSSISTGTGLIIGVAAQPLEESAGIVDSTPEIISGATFKTFDDQLFDAIVTSGSAIKLKSKAPVKDKGETKTDKVVSRVADMFELARRSQTSDGMIPVISVEKGNTEMISCYIALAEVFKDANLVAIEDTSAYQNRNKVKVAEYKTLLKSKYFGDDDDLSSRECAANFLSVYSAKQSATEQAAVNRFATIYKDDKFFNSDDGKKKISDSGGLFNALHSSTNPHSAYGSINTLTKFGGVIADNLLAQERTARNETEQVHFIQGSKVGVMTSGRR